MLGGRNTLLPFKLLSLTALGAVQSGSDQHLCNGK